MTRDPGRERPRPNSHEPNPREDWGASGLRLCYDGTLALDDVSVTAVPGQVTAVVGGDGAGKTSLLRCLAGAVRPDAGLVRSPGALRTGYLPASSGIYPDLTVAENLAFRATAYGMTGQAAANRGAYLMERAGLSAATDRLAGQLSGGMRQKLGVIAALVHQPELLILDEPSTGVDPVSRSDLWWLIASAAADGAAVILSTTYIDDAERAGSVLVLDSGRELAAGTPEEIVAALPGSVLASAERPDEVVSRRAWRRGVGWRIWCPPGVGPAAEFSGPAGNGISARPAAPVVPDLHDAVTVAALARELERPAELAAAALAAAPGPVPRPASGMPLAEVVGVTRRFGQFTAVNQVSIRVRPGEIVGLLGANGAGKTTLIRMLLGLIPATEGRVLLFGEPPSRQTRRRIGYVPQGLGLYDDLTAMENMEFATAVFGGQLGDLPADVAGRSATLVGRLPLGLQRRTAFAQALAHRPDLLILDEPTSGVDPLGRARLWQTIAEAARGGAGALVSTHYMEEAGECDRLIVMADGEVVAAGTAAEIIGGAQVTVVAADNWASAFGRLERAGLPASLAGRTLRVLHASPAEVGAALLDRGAEAGVGSYRIYAAPATLEERFFELARRSDRDEVPA